MASKWCMLRRHFYSKDLDLHKCAKVLEGFDSQSDTSGSFVGAECKVTFLVLLFRLSCIQHAYTSECKCFFERKSEILGINFVLMHREHHHFPCQRWWVQCNSFSGCVHTSYTHNITGRSPKNYICTITDVLTSAGSMMITLCVDPRISRA